MESLKLKNDNNLNIILIILFLVILTPDVRIRNLPAIRLEQIIIIFIVIKSIIKIILNKKVSIKTTKFLNLYLFFPFFMILSSLIGSLKGVTVVVNDFFELYKVFLYVSVYLITCSIVINDQDKIKILKWVVIFISFSGIIAITQYVNLFGLNEIYVPIIAPTQYRTLIDGYPYPRMVGMSSNPNVYAVVAALGFIVSLWLFWEYRKKFFIFSMVLNLIANLMTLSRSGFIFLLIGSVLMSLTNLSIRGFNYKLFIKFKLKKKALLFLLVFIVTIIIIMVISFIYLVPEELIWRLDRMNDLSSDNSWQARLDNWEKQIYFIRESFAWGVGPAKRHFTRVTDNEWLLLLRSYGIIGVIFLVCVFLSPMTEKSFYRNNYRGLYYGIVIGMFLYMIPAAIYHSFQLMIIVMIIFATVSKRKKSIIFSG